jgi:hypothetical protein
MRLIPIVFIVGCAGATAEAPLTVKLGIGRDQSTAALRGHQYCHKDGPPQPIETFPRCDRPGTEWGDSWVTARYDGDTLIELRRWERYAEDSVAVERWNQLVTDRLKLAPDAPDAVDALRAKGQLEPGTRTVKAFRVDAGTVVGIYLLTPTPPENASVLEAIIRLPK